jgi:hypothetical protein
MISTSKKRKKRDERRTDGPDKISPDAPERPSAEDDAIDAAIKRSIDQFGA